MVDLVVLDVNETLFDLSPVAERLADVGLAGEFDHWFASVLRDGMAATLAGRRVTFRDVARDRVAGLLAAHGVDPAEERIAHVLDGFRAVRPHDDVAEGLRLLAGAGVPVVTLTNGAAELTRDALERAGLAHVVGATHDVQDVGRWKPAAEPYLAVVAAHGARPGRSALVAVHPWDVQGAQAAGLIGAWLDRDQRPYPRALPPPDVSGSNLAMIAEHLIGR